MRGKIKQTAGRDQLGDFSPMFAHLNDDVLFGEVWNEEGGTRGGTPEEPYADCLYQRRQRIPDCLP